MPFEEPLAQVYQKMPFDMMTMAMGKDAEPAEEQKKSNWWVWPAIILGTAAVGTAIYLATKKRFFGRIIPPHRPIGDRLPLPVKMTIFDRV